MSGALQKASATSQPHMSTAHMPNALMFTVADAGHPDDPENIHRTLCDAEQDNGWPVSNIWYMVSNKHTVKFFPATEIR